MRVRKTKFKRKIKETVIILSIIIILILLFVFGRQQTVMLKKETYITKTNSTAYIFKEEEYLSLQTDKKLEFSVKEGTKVGANTLLSDDYEISTHRYIDDAIEVIDWCLENPSQMNPKTHSKRLNNISSEIQNLKTRISEATRKNDEETLKTLKAQLEEKEKEKYLTERSTRYIFANTSALKKLKKEYEKKKNESYTDLTTSNLNFSFSGNIFYETTGYENILNPDILPAISSSYFDYIDNAEVTYLSTTNEQAVIKITNSEFLYICAFVPKDTYVSSEQRCKEQKESVYNNFNIENEGGYYNFLERRTDVLNYFPTIDIEIDENIYSGYLIETDTYEDRGKLLIIALRNNLNELMTKNISKCTVYTEKTSAFVIPKKSIVTEEDGKNYIYTLTIGNFTNKVEVEIYKEDGKNVILRAANNPNLKDNLEVIINP